MEIYLLRHGAAERSSPGGRDADRKLTHEGIAAITSVIQQALHAGMNPSLILSSPYTRTMETARIAATLLAYREDILACSALTPESNPQDSWSEIRVFDDRPSILAVMHEPLITALACQLLGTEPASIEFKPSTIMRIDIESAAVRPSGVRRWTIVPDRVPDGA
jgi:phosphohistidine phosphatase SixA